MATQNLRRVCIKKNTKADTCILTDEDESNIWPHVKIYSFKNEVKTEKIKTEQNVKTKQDYRGVEDV